MSEMAGSSSHSRVCGTLALNWAGLPAHEHGLALWQSCARIVHTVLKPSSINRSPGTITVPAAGTISSPFDFPPPSRPSQPDSRSFSGSSGLRPDPTIPLGPLSSGFHPPRAALVCMCIPVSQPPSLSLSPALLCFDVSPTLRMASLRTASSAP